MTTITIEQYTHLMQLIPQVEKFQNVISRMEKKIKSKDSKLKELQKYYENRKWVDLSKLSNVSVFKLLFSSTMSHQIIQEFKKWH